MNRSKLAMLLLMSLALSGNAVAKNLTLDDYLEYEMAADPQISPKGEDVIYLRRRVNKFTDTVDNETWQMRADGGGHRFLLKGFQARWSPNGDRIGYIGIDETGTAQLFVRWMDAQGSTTQITRDRWSPEQFVWSPDGNSIAFYAQVPMTPSLNVELPKRPAGAHWTEDPPVIDLFHYRADRAGLKTSFRHLFVVPAEGGTPRQVTHGEFDIGRSFFGMSFDGPFSWSADSRLIYFSVDANADSPNDTAVSALTSVEVATGKLETVFEEEGSWTSPISSPDGQRLAFIGSPPSELAWPETQLRVMNADGSDIRLLLTGLTSPLFPLHWSSDSSELYVVLEREGVSQVYRVSLAGDATAVTTGSHRLGLDSVGNELAVAVISDPQVTPNVVSIELASGQLQQLTDLNADIFADVDFGETEEIWFTSDDGTPIQGWILTPPGFDPAQNYPLLLQIHGGPQGMYDFGFSYSFQQFAAMGYVVLYTNPRGSTGYGLEFTNAIDGAFPGKVDFEDLMAGVDAVISRGYVDETKLYVSGCSAGGAMTAWVVGHTNRFAAAAARCMVSNWVSLAGTADTSAFLSRLFKTAFLEDPTDWLDHSPLMHAHKVTTPTLIMTGDKDLRTPLAQAEEFYMALKKNGVDTVLIPIKNEWHGTTSIPSNMLRTIAYQQKWFESYSRNPNPT